MAFMQLQAREMKSKRIARVPFAFLLIITAACVPSPAHTPPTLAALSGTPYASLTPITPSPMPSSTSTSALLTATAVTKPSTTPIRVNLFVEQNTPLGCEITNAEGRFFVSGDELFYSYLVVNSTNLDEILKNNFPDWKNFSQSIISSNTPVPLSVIIVDASIQKKYQINPAVTLVTLGESLDWELPFDGDIETRAKNISIQLHDSFADWYLSESGEYQEKYPQIENAATYALYQFFQGDEEKLESWCLSIQNLFLETGTPVSPTAIATLVQHPTPDMCSRSQWRDGIFILSDLQFDSLEIGRAAKVSYNRALIEKNPAWEGFTQYDEYLQHMWEEAGDVFLGRKYIKIGEGVAPGVLLITYGIEYNWEPPENGDLIVRVVYTRDLLWAYFISWWKGNVNKSLYPPIDNAATYALYRYFDGDVDKLERWCSTFVEVFKETPWD